MQYNRNNTIMCNYNYIDSMAHAGLGRAWPLTSACTAASLSCAMRSLSALDGPLTKLAQGESSAVIACPMSTQLPRCAREERTPVIERMTESLCLQSCQD